MPLDIDLVINLSLCSASGKALGMELPCSLSSSALESEFFQKHSSETELNINNI